jgi:protein SCO1/2
VVVSAVPATASEGDDKGQQKSQMGHKCGKCGGGMDHSKHMAMMNKTGYDRSVHEYQLPDLTMLDQAGEEVSVRSVLGPDGPVMVNFIFTTCTTICPVMSATFAQVQKSLGDEADKVRMVSVSIDPEHDTPERLREYAERFDAGPQWDFLTGSLEDSVTVQKALDVYRGNKMNHEPTTLLRRGSDAAWVRMDGLASAADIVSEYRRLVGNQP